MKYNPGNRDNYGINDVIREMLHELRVNETNLTFKNTRVEKNKYWKNEALMLDVMWIQDTALGI